MAMNLRLDSETQDAIRDEARRTGRSQQEVVREAVGRHLGLDAGERPRSALGQLVATGAVRPPRTPNRRVVQRLVLPDELTTAELLDRHDRI